MKRLKQDVTQFLQNKIFVFLLVLTAAGCYGFKLMHPVIGMDDTPYEYYFSDGLVVVVGRWVLFLLNQFLDIGQFAPFLTDFVAVLLLILAAVLWSVVFKRIFGGEIPDWCYLVFACLFISNPLISEVFTYFLHNGIAIGYTFSALAVLAFMEGLGNTEIHGCANDGAQVETESKLPKVRHRIKTVTPYAISALCIWVAIGCYESFAVVFLVMSLFVLFARRICGKKDNPVLSVLKIGGVLVAAILLRSLMTNFMIAAFSLQGLRGEAEQRSLTEMFSWILDEEGQASLKMAVKRAIVMYGAFAYHYLPIAMYVTSCAIVVVYSLWKTIRRRDLWILVYMIGIFAASWILIFIEGKVTPYRACQFLPLFCAAAFLVLMYAGRKILGGKQGDDGKRQEPASADCKNRFCEIARKAVCWAAMIVAAVLIWNQTADMNNWFYVDYRKFEAAKETMNAVALDLERGDYDLSKPLVFVGIYEIPMEIIEDAYVPIGSETFWKINRITSLIDPHLLEKFYRGGYVWVAQTPSLSVIQWGIDAFNTNEQLIKFMEMLGHKYVPETDLDLINQLKEESLVMPEWPKEGSIREEENYILINF